MSSQKTQVGAWGATAGLLLLWWAWIPAIAGLLWLIFHFLFSGFGVANESWNLFWNTEIIHQGILFWIYGFIGIVGSIFILGIQSSEETSRSIGFAAIVVGLVAILSLGQIISYAWTADKNKERYYNTATTFYTPSLKNPPASLRPLLASSHTANGCHVSNVSDVPNCVKQGTLSQTGFAGRTSSATGALLAMQRTSGSTQNVDLLTTTLIYLQGTNEWSAIRDGSGNSAHIEGVVTWKGDAVPKECYFRGDDELDKAIKGAHTNSLSNVMAKKYPTLFWTLTDVYGYCTDTHPVIVFLVRQQVQYLDLTLEAPAGAIVVRGSKSGQPTFKYEANPKGLPGPSYPESIATDQLEANTWAAGRSDDNHGLFGYEPAGTWESTTYLLKSKVDGHTYWVTPLTLNSSQSQLYLAYAMVRATIVTSGQLNHMSIYVLGNTDNRRINVTQLDAAAKDYMAQEVPGFASNGGKLVDYTPLTGDVWRVFAEINGRVLYRLDIAADNSIAPNLVSLENFTGTTSKSSVPTNPNAACATPISQMTQVQIQQCLKTFAGALNGT